MSHSQAVTTVVVTMESLFRALEAAHSDYLASTTPEERAKQRVAIDQAAPADYAKATTSYLFELLEKYGAPKPRAPWVSVGERLPPDDERRVLARNSIGYCACVTAIFRTPWGFDGEDATPERTGYPIGDITHWMLLPELETERAA